jgi:hypothetical protein
MFHIYTWMNELINEWIINGNNNNDINDFLFIFSILWSFSGSSTRKSSHVWKYNLLKYFYILAISHGIHCKIISFKNIYC